MADAPLIHRLDTAQADFDARFAALCARDVAADEALESRVREIIEAVRGRGDAALLELTAELDRREVVAVGELEVPAEALAASLAGLDSKLAAALHEAARRITEFHRHQREQSWEVTDGDGNRLGQRVTPLERVGVYVPGGRAAYPSSVLMNVLPARVAGVEEVVMVVPAPGGEVSPVVLAAAAVAGVDRVFTIGGAQAVAALAYGTESVPRVDKIVGPGNAWVASAKRQVFGAVGIDMIAGPSEVVIIADASADPDTIALDLFAQAEHDERAQSILLTPDAGLLEAVAGAVARLLPQMSRRAVIAGALAAHGALVRVRDLDEAAALANELAAEHLELALADPEPVLERIRHAGAIFVGHHSAEVLGDYCAGPNHVLPTARTARFSSPLGVYDFVKRSSVIRASGAGAAVLAAIAEPLARAEGLDAHARAAARRR